VTRVPGALALAVGALALTGCQEAGPGPIDFGLDGRSVHLCASGLDQPWLFGDSFSTAGDEIRIDRVDLVDPRGVELVSSWLTTEDGAIGVVDYPPSIDVDWQHAVEAPGETVPAHTLQTFAVLVKATSDEPGTADAVAISYSIGDAHFRDVGVVGLVIADDCSQVP
jgi:hypothetical protein